MQRVSDGHFPELLSGHSREMDMKACRHLTLLSGHLLRELVGKGNHKFKKKKKKTRLLSAENVADCARHGPSKFL